MRRLLVPIVTVPLASVAPASAGFLLDQPPIPSSGIASQDFPNQSSYSCACIDDFTITGPVTFGWLRIFGLDSAVDGAALNLDVRAWILAGPDLGAPVVAALHGSQVGEDLVFDLEGLVVDAGTYWIAAQVVRPFAPGQQWYWLRSGTENGGEAVFHNPGGGFGFGTGPIPLSAVGDGGHDMSFRLEAIPAPGTIVTLAIAGLAARRRR